MSQHNKKNTFLQVTPIYIWGLFFLQLIFFKFDPIKFLDMKKIEAVIRKSKFDEVKEALHQVEVNFFSYWDVTGVGNEKQGHVYRGISYSTSDIQRRYLTIVVSDEFMDSVIETILKTAYSGKVGDGKIFISDVIDTYRIRTKEHGKSALN